MTASNREPASTLRLRRVFDAPRDTVFRAWTDPGELARWSAPGESRVRRAEVDLRAGGRYRVEMQAPDGSVRRVVGTYQEVDPPRRLVYTWRGEDAPETLASVITVEFHDRGGHTEVDLTHVCCQSDETDAQRSDGWTRAFEKLAGTL